MRLWRYQRLLHLLTPSMREELFADKLHEWLHIEGDAPITLEQIGIQLQEERESLAEDVVCLICDRPTLDFKDWRKRWKNEFIHGDCYKAWWRDSKSSQYDYLRFVERRRQKEHLSPSTFEHRRLLDLGQQLPASAYRPRRLYNGISRRERLLYREVLQMNQVEVTLRGTAQSLDGLSIHLTKTPAGISVTKTPEQDQLAEVFRKSA